MTEKEWRDRIDAIERGPAIIAEALKGVDSHALDYRPAPNKWSVRQIMAHLADVEIIYGYRMRQILADRNPTIAPINQDDWAQNLNYNAAPLEESLERFRIQRHANVRLLRSVEPPDLAKAAVHPEHKEPFTLAILTEWMAKHDPNHAGQIKKLREQAKAAGVK